MPVIIERQRLNEALRGQLVSFHPGEYKREPEEFGSDTSPARNPRPTSPFLQPSLQAAFCFPNSEINRPSSGDSAQLSRPKNARVRANCQLSTVNCQLSTVKTINCQDRRTHGSVQTFLLRANIAVRHVFGPPAGGRRPEAQEHEATGSGPGMLCLRAANDDAAETIPARGTAPEEGGVKPMERGATRAGSGPLPGDGRRREAGHRDDGRSRTLQHARSSKHSTRLATKSTVVDIRSGEPRAAGR